MRFCRLTQWRFAMDESRGNVIQWKRDGFEHKSPCRVVGRWKELQCWIDFATENVVIAPSSIDTELGIFAYVQIFIWILSHLFLHEILFLNFWCSCGRIALIYEQRNTWRALNIGFSWLSQSYTSANTLALNFESAYRKFKARPKQCKL